ncbi:hypothetical protein Tco_0449360 [Tanacetum coccineum]
MNNSVTIAYRFEITLQLCFFDGSKPKNNDELQPRLSNFFKNFDSNDGDDLCYQGGLDQGSHEVIPSSKETKFKYLRISKSKIEEKERTKPEKDPKYAALTLCSHEVIPSSKETKFKYLRISKSKREEKERTKPEKDPKYAALTLCASHFPSSPRIKRQLMKNAFNHQVRCMIFLVRRTSYLNYEEELNAFTRSPIQYKEYLSEFWYSAKALDNSKASFLIPTEDEGWYRDGDIIIHPTQIFSVNNWALKPNQPKGPPSTAPMVAICNAKKPVAFKAPRTSSQTKKKDSNPSQPLVSTPVDTGMHKEDRQVAGGLTSLRVTSKEGAYPQLSSGMSAFSNLKPIFLASVIIHSEYASGYDASADSTAEADPRTSAANDSLPPQQGKDEGTKNYSLDHIFAGTNPNVLVDKTKSVSDGLETVLTTPETRTSNVAKPSEEIKPGPSKDDPIIEVDESDDGENIEEEPHTASDVETEDTSAPILPPPSSLPTKLKELPSKFSELTDEVKALKTQVHGLEIEVPGNLKELPTKLEEFTMPSVTKGTQALNMFAKVLHSATSKAGDQHVPLAGQASTMPTEGEKNTNQASIFQLFQKRAEKNAERTNLNKP